MKLLIHCYSVGGWQIFKVNSTDIGNGVLNMRINENECVISTNVGYLLM